MLALSACILLALASVAFAQSLKERMQSSCTSKTFRAVEGQLTRRWKIPVDVAEAIHKPQEWRRCWEAAMDYCAEIQAEHGSRGPLLVSFKPETYAALEHLPNIIWNDMRCPISMGVEFTYWVSIRSSHDLHRVLEFGRRLSMSRLYGLKFEIARDSIITRSDLWKELCKAIIELEMTEVSFFIITRGELVELVRTLRAPNKLRHIGIPFDNLDADFWSETLNDLLVENRMIESLDLKLVQNVKELASVAWLLQKRKDQIKRLKMSVLSSDGNLDCLYQMVRSEYMESIKSLDLRITGSNGDWQTADQILILAAKLKNLRHLKLNARGRLDAMTLIEVMPASEYLRSLILGNELRSNMDRSSFAILGREMDKKFPNLKEFEMFCSESSQDCSKDALKYMVPSMHGLESVKFNNRVHLSPR